MWMVTWKYLHMQILITGLREANLRERVSAWAHWFRLWQLALLLLPYTRCNPQWKKAAPFRVDRKPQVTGRKEI